MNNNSTHQKTGNFVSKISGFLKLLTVFPANMPGPDNFVFIRYINPVQLLPVTKSTGFIFFNYRQIQPGFAPAIINQF